MPLSEPRNRREIHHRVIDMKAYARDDGLYDAEAHLVDTKPFPYKRISSPELVQPGDPHHDLWVRLTVDGDFVVRDIEAAAHVTPWNLCKQADGTLAVLVGERLARGWSAKVKERLRGDACCTHLMEMLIPLATTALQGIRALQSEEYRRGDEALVAAKMDSCYAYGRGREIVKMLWPQHYRPSVDAS